MRIGKKSANFILQFEGVDQPYLWPGYESGITIGYGYDLAYEKNLREDWKDKLTSEQINKLSTALGIKGLAAKQIASKFKGIKISSKSAHSVFYNITIPREETKTIRVFPSVELQPADAFGGLVSLVFNRGPLVDNSSRRKEMLEIHKIFINGNPDMNQVADLVEQMKRLWPNKHTGSDLYARRIGEAKLIREAI